MLHELQQRDRGAGREERWTVGRDRDRSVPRARRSHTEEKRDR